MVFTFTKNNINYEVELKYTFRSMMIYEQITDKPFAPKGVSEIIVYFYSTIMGSRQDLDLTFDEFMDTIDSKPELLDEFARWLTDKQHLVDNFASPDEKKPQKSKKKSKSQ